MLYEVITADRGAALPGEGEGGADQLGHQTLEIGVREDDGARGIARASPVGSSGSLASARVGDPP